MATSQDHSGAKIQPAFLWLFHLIAAVVLNKFLPLPLAIPILFKGLGSLILLLGAVIAFSAIGRFKFARTTLNPHAPVSNIVTGGPYRFTRNPMYLGFASVLAGFPLTLGSYWGVIVSPLFILLMNKLVIRYEEAYLEEKFAEQYTSYKSHVRRWI